MTGFTSLNIRLAILRNLQSLGINVQESVALNLEKLKGRTSIKLTFSFVLFSTLYAAKTLSRSSQLAILNIVTRSTGEEAIVMKVKDVSRPMYIEYAPNKSSARWYIAYSSRRSINEANQGPRNATWAVMNTGSDG
jgi:hypothetical protein